MPLTDPAPPTGPAARIRPARQADTDALYDVCLRTGLHGQDASSAYNDPRLLGEVYVGPYLVHAIDLAFVLADPQDAPLGYVLGAADTAAFEDWCETGWWPDLRARYPLGHFPAETADAHVVARIHSGERTPASVLAAYPAHLHVDLLAQAQGRGNGRRLLETLFDALQARGVPGVHLGVSAFNPGAMAFYRHLGFVTLDSDEQGNQLGLRLTP